MSSLNRNAVYEELVSVRLVGMMLTIIVRQELRKNVVRYSTETVGTGALNFMVKTPLLIPGHSISPWSDIDKVPKDPPLSIGTIYL